VRHADASKEERIMRRCDESAWVKIGATCSAGRRSLWLRVNYKSDANPLVTLQDEVESFELCAGREGDDSYVKIAHDNPQFVDLLNVMLDARFASYT
jgi:hypothetical protein